MNIYRLIVCFLIILVGLFYFLTVREGFSNIWGSDFSLYILHAKNISEGKPYEHTGFIYNPSYPSFSPKTYPPVFPLLLTPVYLIFGLDFQAMKMFTIILFLLSLFLLYLNFKDKLPSYSVISIIGIIGFNYYFWNFKDNIQSEFPFLLFSYACLYLAEKTLDSNENLTTSVVGSALATGFFLYLSYGTRSIGIVLLPSILFSEIIKYKKLSFRSVIILSEFLLLASFQNLCLHNDQSYFANLYINYSIIIGNIKSYMGCMRDLWNNGFSVSISNIIFTIFSIFALSGFLFRLRKFGIFEIYLLLYSAIIIIFPFAGERYLMPIIPLYLFYIFYFFTKLGNFSYNKMLTNAPPLLVFIVIVIIGITYGLVYYKSGMPVIKQGIHKFESQELFKFIISNTNKSDVIIFSRPRVMALMTSRSSARCHEPEQDKELWRYFREINASCVVVPKDGVAEEIDGDNKKYLSSFISRNYKRFTIIFCNADFKLYRITPQSG